MEEVKNQKVEITDAERITNLTKENAYLREMRFFLIKKK